MSRPFEVKPYLGLPQTECQFRMLFEDLYESLAVDTIKVTTASHVPK